MEWAISSLLETSQGVESKRALYSIGRTYLGIAGFDKSQIDEIFQKVESGDKEIWNAKYLANEVKGWEGWGMDVFDAFKCLIDVQRTAVLMSGINATLRSLENNRQKSGIVGIDAGTGTGILAMVLASRPSVSRIYALEINPQTAKIAPDFIKEFGFEDKIKVIECDATQVDLGDTKADILVSENLSNGLFDEPQFHIINHLSSWMKSDAKIIPHKAEMFVSLADADWDGVTEHTIAARKLKRLERFGPRTKYAEVISKVHMPIPKIRSETRIDFDSSGDRIANTLLISTDYQIDDQHFPIILKSDSAEFLGNSSAFKLPVEIGRSIGVDLEYPVGMPRKFVKVGFRNDTIHLSPDFSKYSP